LLADGFSVPSGGKINQASWYGASFFNTTFSPFNIEFYVNVSDFLPGTLLAHDIVTPTIVDTGLLNSVSNHVLQFTADIPGFAVAAGTTYYFSVSDRGQENFVWANSNLPSGSFSKVGADFFAVENTARSSQAFTLSSVSPAVPEPSTWAMMILGFAGVGTMAYRRRIGLRCFAWLRTVLIPAAIIGLSGSAFAQTAAPNVELNAPAAKR
jgi:hypothetical protein